MGLESPMALGCTPWKSGQPPHHPGNEGDAGFMAPSTTLTRPRFLILQDWGEMVSVWGHIPRPSWDVPMPSRSK